MDTFTLIFCFFMLEDVCSTKLVLMRCVTNIFLIVLYASSLVVEILCDLALLMFTLSKQSHS